MIVLRTLIVLLLVVGFAFGVYYSGGMQWVSDRWPGYWNSPYAPPPIAEIPPPPPVATYPGTGPTVAPPPYQPPPAPYSTSQADAPPPYDEPAGDGAQNDDATSEPETPYAPESAPPVDVTPLGQGGPPISLHISVGRRRADSGDCIPAYTVFNETHRPILLTQRTHYRGYGHDARDKVIVQPGERQVACAADVYQARESGPRFDYYRQNAWYGPDAIDVPPPVNIRVKD